MAGVQKFTDEELKEALERTGGQPTKAAKLLDVDYTTVYLRIRDNAELKAVQAAARARTFDELSELTLSAIKTGLMPQILTKKGHVVKGNDGEQVTIYVDVDPQVRLGTAARIMGVLKGDAGIVDKSEVDHTTGGEKITGFKIG